MSDTVPKSHAGEHHGDTGDGAQQEVPITRATYLYAFCAALNSCNLGYDIGVSTEAGRLIAADFGLTTKQREIFIASINFWAIFGALASQFFTDRYGRRFTFLVAAVGFIIGMVIMACSGSYAVLLIGRTFVGLGVGTGLAIDPLYIAEVTPAKHRGELVTWSEIATNLGIVFGFSTGLTLANLPADKEWRVMFALGIILPVCVIVLVFTVMPESPRWLVSRNRDVEATEILQKIYPPGYDVQPVVSDIREALEREEAAERAVGWAVICRPTPALRRMLLVGVGTAIAQQAVGVDPIQYYLLDILAQSGVESTKRQNGILMLLGIIKLLFIFVGGKFFDTKGRRPTLFVSLTGVSLSLLVISIVFFAKSENNVGTPFTVTALGFYMAFFSIGMGPGAWLIPSEVFASVVRAKAMSVATTMNRITATVMAATFLSTAEGIGWGGFFLLLSIVAMIVLVFLVVFLPETRGRSLEDMSVYFAEITGDQFILEAESRLRAKQGVGVEMSRTGAGGAAAVGNERMTDAEVI